MLAWAYHYRTWNAGTDLRWRLLLFPLLVLWDSYTTQYCCHRAALQLQLAVEVANKYLVYTDASIHSFPCLPTHELPTYLTRTAGYAVFRTSASARAAKAHTNGPGLSLVIFLLFLFYLVFFCPCRRRFDAPMTMKGGRRLTPTRPCLLSNPRGGPFIFLFKGGGDPSKKRGLSK